MGYILKKIIEEDTSCYRKNKRREGHTIITEKYAINAILTYRLEN